MPCGSCGKNKAISKPASVKPYQRGVKIAPKATGTFGTPKIKFGSSR